MPEFVDRNNVSTWRWLSSTPTSQDLRIMTWNVKRFTDNGTSAEAVIQPALNGRPDFFADSTISACEIGRRIAHSRANIVALQEVWDQTEAYELLRCANLARIAMTDPERPGFNLGPFYTNGAVSHPEVVSDPGNSPLPVASGSAPTQVRSSLSDNAAGLEARGSLLRAAGAVQPHGGVLILSAFPIVSEAHHIYSACKAEDCLVPKGIVHVRLNLGARQETLPPLPEAQRAQFDRGPATPVADDFLDIFATHMNAPSSTNCAVNTLQLAAAIDAVINLGTTAATALLASIVSGAAAAYSAASGTVDPWLLLLRQVQALSVLTDSGARAQIVNIAASAVQRNCGPVGASPADRSTFDGEDDNAGSAPTSRATVRSISTRALASLIANAMGTPSAGASFEVMVSALLAGFQSALAIPPAEVARSNTEVLALQMAEAQTFINARLDSVGGRDRSALILGDLNTDEGHPDFRGVMFPVDPNQPRRVGHDNLLSTLGGIGGPVGPLGAAVDGALDAFELSATPTGTTLPMLLRLSAGEEPDLIVDLTPAFGLPHPGRLAGRDPVGPFVGFSVTSVPPPRPSRDRRDVYGTDLSSPASRLQFHGGNRFDLRDFYTGPASKLDYILHIIPTDSPRYVLAPTADTGPLGFTFRVLDLDPTRAFPSAAASSMSDHLAVETRLRRFRLHREEVFDSRRASRWEIRATQLQCTLGCEDGFLATLDLFGHLWQRTNVEEGASSVAGRFPFSNGSPDPTCDYSLYAAGPPAGVETLSTLGDGEADPHETLLAAAGWHRSFALAGRTITGTGTEAQWTMGLAILDRDLGSDDDVFDVAGSSEDPLLSPANDDVLMRFGFDTASGQNLFGAQNGAGAFVTPLRSPGSASGHLTTWPVRVLRLGEYEIDDAGNGTTCVRDANRIRSIDRASARWVARLSYSSVGR
ncbi:MAG: hypothetical protein HY909_23870 [Deltaproteobacteria bacterium]|nr:hypothetical protein [Deltaproteobacteria bacterium]